MGVVYRVRHVTLGGEYALKAFKMESEDSSMAKERFRAEAQVLRQLSHPGLPKVYDLGFDERAECYYLVDHAKPFRHVITARYLK
jgi:serine/threonine protein kinase